MPNHLLAAILNGRWPTLEQQVGRALLIHLPGVPTIGSASDLDRALHGAPSWSGAACRDPSPVATTETDLRRVEEDTLIFGGAEPLPVASVLDLSGVTAHLRVYHSTWPLTGHHALRPPLLAEDPAIKASDIVAQYQEALAVGDVEAIVASFENDGLAREPSAGAHSHRGREALDAFYQHLCSPAGGIALEHCTLTDDGVRCAIEYNCTGWAGSPIPPQSGVAVYERGATGRLAAARIYDDVDPPLPD